MRNGRHPPGLESAHACPRNESQAMSRIDQAFKRVKSEGRSALIPFVMAGDPDLEVTEDLVLKMAECGADIIELGVPFSDPIVRWPDHSGCLTACSAKRGRIERGFSCRKESTGDGTRLWSS